MYILKKIIQTCTFVFGMSLLKAAELPMVTTHWAVPNVNRTWNIAVTKKVTQEEDIYSAVIYAPGALTLGDDATIAAIILTGVFSAAGKHVGSIRLHDLVKKTEVMRAAALPVAEAIRALAESNESRTVLSEPAKQLITVCEKL